MRCRKCRGRAVVEIRRHNAAYCAPHFNDYFVDQVTRAISSQKMFGRDDSVLVSVSGGKDSLALWQVLLKLGYRATGFYVHLGIGEYSAESHEKCRSFAAERGVDLIVEHLPDDYGFSIGEIPDLTRRTPCSACGLSKRYLFNRMARLRGFDVLVTGHNLDDEAATLFGNVLRWQTGYLGRQAPVLESEGESFVRKVKPLYRLTEYETAAYAVLNGIDYVVEECPNAVGATSIRYKEALNALEAASPGTKQSFLMGFLEKVQPIFAAQEDATITTCQRCGEPTTGDLCAFCRLADEVERRRQLGPARPKRATIRLQPVAPEATHAEVTA